MNYFITFNPHRNNASDKDLIVNFKRGLQRYYRKLLGRGYHKHKDQQYKMNVVLSHGKDKLVCKHPHLHIIANITEGHICGFMEFMKEWMKKYYPKLSTDFQYLPTELDKLRTGLYCLKQTIREYKEVDFQTGNYIV